MTWTERDPLTGRCRWACSCGRVGLWLDTKRAAEWNAMVHSRAHEEEVKEDGCS